ncbi:hypothetical protein GF362_01550 [Candidatus Dojkabacteria bacterium]|nr:hypothetical protein [Candidatus Dojkabacteria bacterium]
MTEFERTITEEEPQPEERKTLGQKAKEFLDKNMAKFLGVAAVAGLGVAEYYDLFGVDFTSFDEVALRGEPPEPDAENLYDEPFDLAEDAEFTDRFAYWVEHFWQLNPFKTPVAAEPLPDGFSDSFDVEIEGNDNFNDIFPKTEDYEDFEERFSQYLEDIYEGLEDQYQNEYTSAERAAKAAGQTLDDETIEEMRETYIWGQELVHDFRNVNSVEDFRSFLDDLPASMIKDMGNSIPEIYRLGLVSDEQLNQIAQEAASASSTFGGPDQIPQLQYEAFEGLRQVGRFDEDADVQRFLYHLSGTIDTELPPGDQTGSEFDQFDAFSSLLRANNEDDVEQVLQGVVSQLKSQDNYGGILHEYEFLREYLGLTPEELEFLYPSESESTT